jgi:hypothetical protein
VRGKHEDDDIKERINYNGADVPLTVERKFGEIESRRWGWGELGGGGAPVMERAKKMYILEIPIVRVAENF